MAIERKFVNQNLREFKVKQFVAEQVQSVGLSDVSLKKTPLGDKIVVTASRPGLVVGRGGANIQALTKALKAEFELENPQIEIEEIESPDLDAAIVAERVVNTLERFGSGRTKSIGHRAMSDVMRAGALGVEILITGKIPSMRARRWRFYTGYLKKSGDIAVEGVRKSIQSVTLKSGLVGVQVSIMPPSVKLPDHVTLTEQPVVEVEAPEGEEASAESPAPAEDATNETAQETTSEEKTPTTTESVSESEDSGTEDKK